mgnify:FL=1
MIWVIQPDSVVANVATANVLANQWTNFTNGAGADTMVDAKLQLNGHDRFATRQAGYFNLVQPYQHHTSGPAVGIYVYSFAIKPEEHQPSGSINMSRIDNASLAMTLASAAASKVYVFCTNYNILRVMSGMGQLTMTALKSIVLTVYRQYGKKTHLNSCNIYILIKLTKNLIRIYILVKC